MRNNRLYENFAQELQSARDMRYDSYDLLPKQRKERSNDQYLQAHNGDWFSFYDLMIEKHQCWTPMTDILFTFNYVYQKYQEGDNYATRIFIERCTNSDISHIKSEIVSYFKHKKFQCNVYTVLMNNATDNVNQMMNEIQQSEIPTLVFIDADNHTYDDFVSGEMTAEEVGNIIDDITEKLLPASGVLVYFERYPKYDGDAMVNTDPYGYDDPDRHNPKEINYPEGYGTMEINFDE